MKSSNQLINAIKAFEGLSLRSYLCPAGKWTIGYGHTGKEIHAGQHITEEQAEALLRADLVKFETFVNNLRVCTRQGQFDALVDFCFNLGTYNLTNSTLLKYIRKNKPLFDIQQEFNRWVYATVNGKKTKLNGLVTRRAWEAKRYGQTD